MFIKKYEKVYLFCCLCMDRGKLEIEKKATLIAEENELLREDYLKCNNYALIY